MRLKCVYLYHPSICRTREQVLLDHSSNTNWDHLKWNQYAQKYAEYIHNVCNTVPVNHLHDTICQKRSKQMQCSVPILRLIVCVVQHQPVHTHQIPCQELLGWFSMQNSDHCIFLFSGH